MKTSASIIGLSFFAFAVAAQTNNVPVPPGVPADAVSWVNLIIAGLTPVVIAGIKFITPRIPGVALPFIAPAIGLALAQIEAWVTGNPASLVLGAAAGGLGVFLRELVDQSKKLISGTPTKSINP
jgi:hypothetical protein